MIYHWHRSGVSETSGFPQRTLWIAVQVLLLDPGLFNMAPKPVSGPWGSPEVYVAGLDQPVAIFFPAFPFFFNFL